MRLHFSAKSAPNSIFSSPVTSPRTSSNVDFYDPSIIFPQDFNDILRVSPAKTAQSPERTPLRSPGSLLNPEGCQSQQLHKHSSRVLPENNHVDAHPLPLPPRASPLPAQSSPQHQPNIVQLTVENSPSMKGQWQKGKLIGRGSYGSVYHATNLYVLHLSLPSWEVLNCCHVTVMVSSLILWKIANKCNESGCNCGRRNSKPRFLHDCELYFKT